MSSRRHYPSPNLDAAIYYLQNHPEDRGKNPKWLCDYITINHETIGRSAWERAKRLLCTHREPRNLITVDMNTWFIGYVGDSSRLVTKAKTRELLRLKIGLFIEGGYTEIFHSKDKKFYVYAAPAMEAKKAA